MGTDVNPVLLLVRDNLEMNKRVIQSILSQSIPTTLVVIDNSQGDETLKWCLQFNIPIYPFRPQIGVSRGWNLGLSGLFKDGFEYVLVPNSDTILPSYFYAELLSYNVSFVTGYSTEDMKEIGPLFHHERKPLVVAPDFSAFLIRRSAWETVGLFDEDMKLYASDNDWAVRAHRAGVPLYRSNTPFYHERSSTLKNAPPEERREIQLQADRDREVFKAKYGCMPWEAGYAELFK